MKEKIKVKLLACLVGNGFARNAGEIHVFDRAAGERLIEAGFAEEIVEEVEKQEVKKSKGKR